jgi:tetraacyldisaccharide 4'-kinase
MSRGLKPSIVLRGYGEDEVEVHRVLNPTVSVHASADRIAAVQWVEREGSDSVVLDDAFQHRALRAHASVVLVAVEDWVDRPRLLPRGPWREPLRAMGRATLVVATRKVSSPDEALRVRERLAELQPALPQAQAYVGLAGLARYHAAEGRLGETVASRGFVCPLVVGGVAKPETVFAQLAASGVSFERSQAFGDHHRYSDVEVARIAADSLGGPVVMTLKDAVKLGPVLPPEIEIYVPLQEIVWEVGGEEIECLLANLMARTAAVEAEEE